MIRITRTIAIDESEIQEYFIRASGPGGQNVNKVATAVQLRFDVANSRSLPEEVRKRLTLLAGNRITEDGILIIDARRFRTQGRNREDATDRLVELIRNAAQRPKIRRKTRPTLASKMRRRSAKPRGDGGICNTKANHRVAFVFFYNSQYQGVIQIIPVYLATLIRAS